MRAFDLSPFARRVVDLGGATGALALAAAEAYPDAHVRARACVRIRVHTLGLNNPEVQTDSWQAEGRTLRRCGSACRVLHVPPPPTHTNAHTPPDLHTAQVTVLDLPHVVEAGGCC
jgi:hypothetical protein